MGTRLELLREEMKKKKSADSSKVQRVRSSLTAKMQRNQEMIKAQKEMTQKKWWFPVIYRIADEIREPNKNPYSPTTVSIGPLHEGNERLRAMEAQKLMYMDALFRRTPRIFEVVRDDCVAAMLQMESMARTYYAEVMMDEGERFAEMMLIDSCFIIELVYRDYDRKKLGNNSLESGWDPILDNEMLKLAVTHDLIRLENQIPLYVLEILFDNIVERIPEHPALTDCLLSFFGDMIGFNQDKMQLNVESNIEPTHILHLLHNCYGYDDRAHRQREEERRRDKEAKRDQEPAAQIFKLKMSEHETRRDLKELEMEEGEGNRHEEELRTHETCRDLEEFEMEEGEGSRHEEELRTKERRRHEEEVRKVEELNKKAWNELKYSATQLDLAGVKFHRGNDSRLFDVRFRTDRWLLQTGHLEIPPFRVTHSTEPLMKNLIAFELGCPLMENYFMSHAFLMDKLINSAQDVDLLVEAGVIHNYLGSAEDASILYNNICRHVVIRDFQFPEPCTLLNNHCRRFWPRCLATLKRDYFGSPWSVIAFAAAACVFTLALLQTLFGGLSYYNPRH